jgi:hypothetical protein
MVCKTAFRIAARLALRGIPHHREIRQKGHGDEAQTNQRLGTTDRHQSIIAVRMSVDPRHADTKTGPTGARCPESAMVGP